MSVLTIIVVSFLVVPIFVVLAVNCTPRRLADKFSLQLAGASAVIQMASAVASFVFLAVGHLHEYEFSLLWDINKPSSERFAINSFSLVLLFCIGMVSLVSVLVANQTVTKKRSAFVTLLMTLTLGMNGMVIVTDLFSLYVFLEIVGISSFVLIAMFRSETELEGSFKYLVMSALGSIFILTGLAFLFMQIGSLQYSYLAQNVFAGQSPLQSILVYIAFVLLIAGFAIKSGAVPFHSWLPDAHQSANTAVSILLSGIVIKVAGIYGFIILTRLFSRFPSINLVLAIMGAFTIMIGALLALRQNHFKRIVALSSVSQMGYIMLGVSTGSTLGLLGAFIYIFNHATVKCTLFANAAAIHEQAGTLDINEMGGLQNKMPITGFSSIAAFLSLTGLPPFAGFWSKLLIILALWDDGSKILAGFAILASILTAAYFIRMQTRAFFGELPARLEHVKEAGGSIRFAEVMLSAIMLIVGVGFPLVLIYFRSRGLI